MTGVWVAAVVVALIAAQALPHLAAGVAVFGAAGLLVLVLAVRARRRAGAGEDMEEPADAPRGRVRRWAWVCAGVCACLGGLVWALGLWVLWATAAAGLVTIFVRFRPSRSSTPSMPIVNPVSSPVDSGLWLAEIPGRAADAVDAGRLIRGHADAAGVQPPDVGEEA